MDKKDDAKQRPDPITGPIGDLGPAQMILYMLVLLSKVPTGTVTLSTVFLTAPMKFSCVDPPDEQDACSDNCKKIEFNRTIFEENIISEWNLVCVRASLASLSQTIVMFGILVGSIVAGTLSDSYGRRIVFVNFCMLNLATGLLVCVSPWFWFFCLFRFLDAVAVGGIMVTSFVIIMEVIGKSRREIMSILYQLPFNLGHASLPLIAYHLRSWRQYHFAFSVFSVVYVVYYCTILESPRWLFAKGRLDESAAVLEKYAKRNGKPTDNIRADLEAAYKLMTASAPPKKGTLVDLFRYPNLRIKTLVMAFNWLVVCMSYYGVSQFITNLSGDIFTNVAIGACLGVPGTILCVVMSIFLGRRYTLIISNSISAFGLLSMAFIPNIDATMQVVLATIGLFGASVTFPVVYLYGGELFPTVVRNSGVGICSMLGRFGSMVAPFISQLSVFGLSWPPMIIGTFCAVAALSTFRLPETRGFPLPETIEDGENFGKKQKPQQA